MLQLIFWNLAGARPVVIEGGKETAPKPVTVAEQGTSLVSGYSQGQLKMFLEGGQFEKPKEELTFQEEKGGEEYEFVVVERKMNDPVDTVRKAIGHEAYRMLKVMD